jgi:hypothetical protein
LHKSVEEFDLCPLNTQFRKCVWRENDIAVSQRAWCHKRAQKTFSAPDSRSCSYFVRSVCINGHVHPHLTPMNTPEHLWPLGIHLTDPTHFMNARCDTAMSFSRHTHFRNCVFLAHKSNSSTLLCKVDGAPVLPVGGHGQVVHRTAEVWCVSCTLPRDTQEGACSVLPFGCSYIRTDVHSREHTCLIPVSGRRSSCFGFSRHWSEPSGWPPHRAVVPLACSSSTGSVARGRVTRVDLDITLARGRATLRSAEHKVMHEHQFHFTRRASLAGRGTTAALLSAWTGRVRPGPLWRA